MAARRHQIDIPPELRNLSADEVGWWEELCNAAIGALDSKEGTGFTVVIPILHLNAVCAALKTFVKDPRVNSSFGLEIHENKQVVRVYIARTRAA